jgi:hypothetical protein
VVRLTEKSFAILVAYIVYIGRLTLLNCSRSSGPIIRAKKKSQIGDRSGLGLKSTLLVGFP